MYIDVKKITFLKNITLLASGSLFAQLFNIVGAPIITRIYDVETIGIYSYILTIVTSFTAILNFRYDLAIVSEENTQNVFALIKVNFILGVITSTLITISLWIYFIYYNASINITPLVMFIVFLVLISNSISNILTSYNNRMKEYKIMAVVGGIRTSFQNVGGILLGLVSDNVICLLMPYAFGQLLGIRQQSKTLIFNIKKIINIRYGDLVNVLKIHRNMFFFSTPAMMANSLSYASVTVFLEMLFDMAVVGYYSLSTRVLGLPLLLISGNVGKVFFQEAQNEYVISNCFHESFKKSFLILCGLALPIGFVMYFISPLACSYVFGNSWTVAGRYIQILTPFFLFRFIGTALSPGLLVCKKQRLELVFNILLMMAAVSSYIITRYYNRDVDLFLYCISASNSLVYCILIFFVWSSSRKDKQ